MLFSTQTCHDITSRAVSCWRLPACEPAQLYRASLLWSTLQTALWLKLSLPVNSSSCAQCPSKVCRLSPHTTRVSAPNEPISGGFWTTASHTGMQREASMFRLSGPTSRGRKVPIACNACCNALVLFVTQGHAEDVYTHIYTVCIHIKGEYNTIQCL